MLTYLPTPPQPTPPPPPSSDLTPRQFLIGAGAILTVFVATYLGFLATKPFPQVSYTPVSYTQAEPDTGRLYQLARAAVQDAEAQAPYLPETKRARFYWNKAEASLGRESERWMFAAWHEAMAALTIYRALEPPFVGHEGRG